MAKIKSGDFHNGELLSIGDASQLSGISSRALRHYDSLNLLQPDHIGENRYRYYSLETILRVPVINYLKLMGFSLDEVMEMFADGDLGDIKKMFADHQEECAREINHLEERKQVIEDWISLVDEAKFILSVKPTDVSLKYLPDQEFIYMPYRFWGNYADATVNLDFTSFVEEDDQVITGPVTLCATDAAEFCRAREKGEECDVIIMQRALRPIAKEHRVKYPSSMYLSTYHVGPFEKLGESHRRLISYAEDNGYTTNGDVFERYVVDYWTTYNQDQFVVEILMPVSR